MAQHQSHHHSQLWLLPFKKINNTILPLPSLWHNWKKLSELDIEALGAIYEQEELGEVYRLKLKAEFSSTNSHVRNKNTKNKDEAMQNWCERITSKTGRQWCYIRVNQKKFDRVKDNATTLRQIVINKPKANAETPLPIA